MFQVKGGSYSFSTIIKRSGVGIIYNYNYSNYRYNYS